MSDYSPRSSSSAQTTILIPPGDISESIVSIGDQSALEVPATPSSQSQLPNAAVQYVLAYKDSKNDRSWAMKQLNERDYDKIKRAGSSSVLEMRKEAIVERKTLDSSHQSVISVTHESMTIYSPRLLKVIPELVGYYPGQKLDGLQLNEGTRRMVVNRPFRMLGGALEGLAALEKEYITKTEGIAGRRLKEDDEQEYHNLKEIAEHIGLLLRELNKVLKMPLEDERRHHAANKATFDMLWLLYRPGTEVYTRVHDQWTCCRVYSPLWETIRQGEDSVSLVVCKLRMWYLDFDGKQVQRKWHVVKISNYSGARLITDLPTYPVKYIANRDNELKRLEERGRGFLRYLQQQAPQCEYSGYVFAKQDKHSNLSERQYYEGRVIVDPIFYAREHGLADQERYWVGNTDNTNAIPEPMQLEFGSGSYVPLNPCEHDISSHDRDSSYYRVFSSYIRGFILGTRRWVWLHLDALKDCVPNKMLIEHLQIDEDALRLVKGYTPTVRKGLRADYVEDKIISTDPIRGKGEGRIMLLHGHPGTGKTFVVECISEFSERPLLRLSCKELGTDPELLESKLWKWFQRAKEWQGILLIDEADIFLKRRSGDDDIVRQAVVVAFLRSLEYYRGNLFLTANIWAKFDEAVLSRISCVIGLEGLTVPQRTYLRQWHVKRIMSSKDPRYQITKEAEDLFKEIDHKDCKYNGRDIKNFFHTVLVLATETHRKEHNGECVTIMAHDVDVVKENMGALQKFQAEARKRENFN